MRFHQNKIALVYDFDGTLSPQAMQHYGVLPELDVEPAIFWKDVKEARKADCAEELLVYMKQMIDIADSKRVKLDKDAFRHHGKTIKFFPGVETWFQRVNEFVGRISCDQVEVQHYIVSSGLADMIQGCEIAHYFKEIFACEFLYDQYGHPVWPARVISDTSKTQYLFRINKGVLDVNESINSHMPEGERAIPFDQIIYFGDGDTDVPSMAVLMKNGGHAIAVHKDVPREIDRCEELRKAKRVDFYAEADYRAESVLENLVKQTLEAIVQRVLLRKMISQQHGRLTAG